MKKIIKLIIFPVVLLCLCLGLASCGGLTDEEVYKYATTKVVTDASSFYEEGTIRVHKTVTTTYTENGIQYTNVLTEEFAPSYGYAIIEKLNWSDSNGNTLTKYISADAYIIQKSYLSASYTGIGKCGYFHFVGYLDGATVYTSDTEIWNYTPYVDSDGDGIIDNIEAINAIITSKLSDIYNPVKSTIKSDTFTTSDINPGSYLKGTNFHLYYANDEWNNALTASKIEIMTKVFKNMYYPKKMISTNKSLGIKKTYEWDAAAYYTPDVVSDPFAQFYGLTVTIVE